MRKCESASVREYVPASELLLRGDVRAEAPSRSTRSRPPPILGEVGRAKLVLRRRASSPAERPGRRARAASLPPPPLPHTCFRARTPPANVRERGRVRARLPSRSVGEGPGVEGARPNTTPSTAPAPSLPQTSPRPGGGRERVEREGASARAIHRAGPSASCRLLPPPAQFAGGPGRELRATTRSATAARPALPGPARPGQSPMACSRRPGDRGSAPPAPAARPGNPPPAAPRFRGRAPACRTST